MSSNDLIDEACDRYNSDFVVVALSGGDDSMAALTQAVDHPNFRGAMHLNTGIGVELSRDHVRQTCKDVGCPLLEFCAKDNVDRHGNPDPQDYESMVLEHGFPGPTKFGHGKMYDRLKERGIRRLIRSEGLNARKPLVIVTGVRSQESSRRMGFVQPIQRGVKTRGGLRDLNRVWVAGIHDWSKRDCLDAIKQKGLVRSPVAKMIHRSGECFCGGFADDNREEGEELHELTLYPELRGFGNYMLNLDSRVYREHGWHWWERKPKWAIDKKRGQKFFWDMEKLEAGPLCHDCEGRSDG